MVRALVTGGAGFIGHELVRYLLEDTGWDLVLLDRLDISGNLNRLAEIGAAKNPRVKFIFHDLRAPLNDSLVKQIGPVEYIVHMAAATHVDRSIDDPMSFVLDNVVGTTNMLDLARKLEPEKMLHFSTDEVFGPAPGTTRYKEWDRYRSGNPYAASKAGAEEMCIAYENTFKVPVLVSHTMNVIGKRQAPEKFLPSCIKKIGHRETVTIHADKTKTHSGSRFYISTEDVAEGVLFLLRNGQPGDKYNLVGKEEVTNLDLARKVAGAMSLPLFSELVDFHSSRPGHDLRYGLDGSKMKEMGWEPKRSIDETVQAIVNWTLNNRHWM